MNEHLIKTLDPYVIAIAFVLLYLAEHIFPQQKKLGSLHHDLKNFSVGALNALFNFWGGYYFQQVIGWVNRHEFGVFNMIYLPIYFSFILQILLLDLYMYWWHRFNHVNGFLWRFHRFHHLDKEMNSTTALRFHTVELLLSYIFRLLIFPLFGFSITAIVYYSLIFFPIVILHHSNLFISARSDNIFRKIFVSPNMHRIHHSNKFEETNSNYSSVFPWWDRLFKTNLKTPKGNIHFGVE